MFKKIREFYYYYTTVNNIKDSLWEKFRLRVDYIGRLYTVYNFTEKEREFGSETKFAVNKIKNFVKEVEMFLLPFQLYGLLKIEIKPLNEYNNPIIKDNNDIIPIIYSNYLIVISYKDFNPIKFLKRLLVFLLLLMSSIIIILFI